MAALLDPPQIGKYIDTSLIDVDVQPTVVRCLLKGQLLQLCLSEARGRGSARANRHAPVRGLKPKRSADDCLS